MYVYFAFYFMLSKRRSSHVPLGNAADREAVYVNSVLANLNARAIVVETMAPEAVVDRGPFGSGQNPFEKKRKQTSTATTSEAGPSSRDRAQVCLLPSRLLPLSASSPYVAQFSTVIDPVMITMSNLPRHSSATLAKVEEDRISWT